MPSVLARRHGTLGPVRFTNGSDMIICGFVMDGGTFMGSIKTIVAVTSALCSQNTMREEEDRRKKKGVSFHIEK